MRKTLIIGFLGMLGQDLLKVFSNAAGWDLPEIDITDKEQVEQKIKELRPALVINATAYNAVDKCENKKEFEIAKKINGDAVGYLADICLQLNATLIHYSTNYVFGEEKKQGCGEDDAPNPINQYGQTKLIGEQEILQRADKGLKYYLIRTSKLFGQKGKSKMAKENFFDKMMKLAETQDELQVVDDELSNFTYTPDLAQMTKNLLTWQHQFGVYHIVNENPCTWYDAAKILFDILGKNVKLIPVSADQFPRPAKRPRYGILLNTRLPKLRRWEEALVEYLHKDN